LSRYPLADVWIAIPQCNPGSFAPSEKNNAILTGQGHILEIENDAAILGFQGNEQSIDTEGVQAFRQHSSFGPYFTTLVGKERLN
jgi:hypothetical protein